MMRKVSSTRSKGEFDLIDSLERALYLARADSSQLTAHLLEMALLNEGRGILERATPDGQA